MLTREQILGFKPKVEKIQVPEWGGEVFIRPLSGRARDAFAGASKEAKDTLGYSRLLAGVVIASVVDQDGNALLKAEDAENLIGMDARTLDALSKAIMKVSGLTEEAADAAKKD